LNISGELQEERIKNIYPDNYIDHLQNRNHASENNTFQWINVRDGVSVSNKEEDQPHLSIDSSMDKEYIKNLVKEFINPV